MFEPRPLADAVASHVGGGTPSRQVAAYWNGPIPWASVKDFAEGGHSLLSTQESITAAGLSASASNLIPAATPLVCTRMAVGRSALAPMPVAINQDVKALSPATGTTAAYLLRLLQFIQPRAEAAAVGSTVKGIRIQDYLSIPVPMAPWAEQDRITEILDTLDITIRQSEAIIKKLEQVKQGLRHDLLTRGIDANGELRPPQSQASHLYKDSPLGWIPKDWRSVQLGHLIKDHQSGVYKNRLLYGQGENIVGVADLFRHDSIDGQEFRRVRTSCAERTRFRLSAGDLVYAESSLVLDGIAKTVAVSAGGEGTLFAWHTRRLTPDPSSVHPFYLALALGAPSCRRYVISRATQTALTGIPVAEYLATPVPVPPVDEQREIVVRLGAADSRRQAESSFVAKLNAQKAGLMNDLLTGRVRVTPLLA